MSFSPLMAGNDDTVKVRPVGSDQLSDGHRLHQRMVAERDHDPGNVGGQGVPPGQRRRGHISLRFMIDHHPDREPPRLGRHLIPLVGYNYDYLVNTGQTKCLYAAGDNRSFSQGEKLLAAPHAPRPPGGQENGGDFPAHFPFRTAINCPTMLTAISSGVSAPISTPT